ncbi:MAG: ThiF family adenylyltransferase [Methanobacterium sp.]|uniref:ThiF family adenylyltransferase n=1 Tax=Methanobacterium sp. TaxID=2164 RepID=UPI003D650862|nr:ThiF family adenylyltransferase [Methanobacterium sp.]
MQDRYSRQAILQNIGKEGQEKLAQSHVIIIGCGALGTVAANNLTRAGIGKISILDRDFVELNNLQRQMLFDESDVGETKAIAATRKLESINSTIEIIPIVKDLNHTNIDEIIKDVDLVLDGTDNIQTRMLINDVCVREKIPWIYTGAIGMSGMTMNILPGAACIRCLYPNIPKAGSLPTCDTMGVLNTLTVIMGSMASTETLKILLGELKPVNEHDSNLIVYDAWNNSFDNILVRKNEECACCVDGTFDYLNAEDKDVISSLCGRNAIQITPANAKEINLHELASNLEHLGSTKCADFILLFKIDKYEISVFRDGRAIIKGTNDEKVARSIYARYIGT